jgi:hypothetical protein
MCLKSPEGKAQILQIPNYPANVRRKDLQDMCSGNLRCSLPRALNEFWIEGASGRAECSYATWGRWLYEIEEALKD